MCRTCYTEAGSPIAPTYFTPGLVDKIKKLYRVHCTGGPLHVPLDDWNLDDGSIGAYYDCWQLEELDSPEGEFNGLTTRQICDDIVALLNKMTLAQRQYAVALAEGYVE